MPLILQASQQPVGICGYGNFPVARDTFKRVIEIFDIIFQRNIQIRKKTANFQLNYE